MTNLADNSGRKQRGKPFKPGQSGNPAGRPAGSRNAALVALDQIAEGAAPALLDVLVKAGMAGDTQAARLVLERAWPIRKGRAITLDLPPVIDAAGVRAAMARITKAAASAEITPDEAQALAALVEGQRRAIETQELEQRISAIETKLGKDKTDESD
ncbi:MAG TPA: DUF5681 domain-containing protein [Acidiphilium sp.]|nr:MAG: hypothetical protein B7Z67_02085 [Acidiphilium sp. 21-60-14]OYV92083.1 MAG: hypothetical protein B7Z57_01940 [Acidiphilium sp. 37-60-79]HQT88424.1 DUF5681 domain-containing protein [Acidiphilium sp.]HQU23249.1 DUF5681 domain-containing protein [Acidiphilium sp.]